MPLPLPSGLVTILYADVEKSSQGYQSNDEALYERALDRLLDSARSLSESNSGIYVWHSGDGFYSAFSSPTHAVKCAVALQEATRASNWPPELPVLRIRIGIHTDSLAVKDGEYRGFGLWRAHRLMDAANGRQILLSGAAYELCRQSLESEGLTAAPLGSCRLRDLLGPEQIYRIDSPFAELSTLPPRIMPAGRHNFPVEERPFIGRGNELEAIRAKFLHDGAQLVTITGFGGIGKTRLALRAAAGIVEEFPDGAWLVELDNVTNEESMLAEIAIALQMNVGGSSTEQVLLSALAHKKMLLILDCFEKLVDEARVLERMLSRLPDLKCLVTSRRPLRLAREHEYELKPMDTEIAGRGKSAPSDGITLFVEAARHTLHDFELTPKNRLPVQQICQSLEGIPLALVLAASRLKSYSLEELLAQAQKSRIGAARVRTTSDDRHSSLPRVIDDSMRLLSFEDRRLLRQLNVFSGGFFREDALAVCEQDIDVSEGIEELREHSLVQVQTIGDRNRFRLLDTVREYLECDGTDLGLDIEACRLRHAEHYLSTAREIEALMEEGRWKEGSAFLLTELGNLRAAIASSIDLANQDLIIGFADAVGRVFVSSGLWHDFERLAKAAETELSRRDDPMALGRLLARLGALAKQRGALDDARKYWERRLRICEDIKDEAGCADCRQDLAGLAHMRGDLEHAEALINDAADLAARIGDQRQFLAARTRQAMIALDAKDLEAAKSYARSARTMLESCDDKHFAVFIYPALAKVYRLLGDCAAATAMLTTALQMARDGERTFDSGNILLELSRTCEADGRMLDTARFCVAACKIHQSLGSRLQQEAKEYLDRIAGSCDPDVHNFIGRTRNLLWQETLDWRDNSTEQFEEPGADSDIVRSAELVARTAT